MSGYLHYDKTGVPEVDEIIEALEDAGNAFHHTDGWGDKLEWLDGESHNEIIQQKLKACAERINKGERK